MKHSITRTNTRGILAILALLAMPVSVMAQGRTVHGTVKDSENNIPMVGVAVLVDGSTAGTVTGLDGQFSIKVDDASATIRLSCLGYEDLPVTVGRNSDLGTIVMVPQEYLLSNVTITAQTAVPRKTPVVSSNVYAIEIEEKLGNQEFTEALKYTPGVHVNRQGGGWGDSEIFMRGFDNANIAVMLNGIPINDLETGTVYWSDWASLSDITAVMQTQRGIGASKVSAPSVGGTINILTKGSETEAGGAVSYMLGNDGYGKASFSVSSGLMRNGWAVTLMGSHASGDGYVQGTDFNVYSYFANISKKFNDHHQLNLMAFGAAHRQHSRSNALTRSEWEYVADHYTLKNRDWTRYNPDYGFNNSGERKSNEYSEFHKPFVSLNYTWKISDVSSWSTNIYGSYGTGGGYAGKADEDEYSEYDWYSTDYGALNRKFRNADGTYSYGTIEDINAASTTGSKLVMSQQVGKQYNIGLVSTFTTRFLDRLDFYGGLDLRRYRCGHTNELIDLFGGEYYIDPCRSEVSNSNNSAATSEWMQEHLGVGDVIYRDYDTHIMQEGLFGQLEYSGQNITAFVSGSLAYTTYWKYDRLYYDSDHARSDNIGFFGGTAKGGVNWNIDSHNNVFANVGFISRAPQFKSGAFMSPTSSNVTNKLAKNEKSATAEIGYGFHNQYLNFKACGYFTEWIDKSMTKKGKITGQYYINMTGVNSRHMGLEFELKATPARWVEMGAMLSLGDWQWDSDNVKGYAYNLAGQAIDSEGNVTTPGSADHAWAAINMKGVKVGGSAQTTAALDVTFKPFTGFRIGGGYTLFDRNYAYYSLSGSSLKLGKELYVSEPWKIPASGCLDLRASYQFNIGSLRATAFGQMFNALNSRYIEKAWNPSNVSSSRQDVNEDDVYYFYALGRTWSFGLKVNF